jgi:hypothetical protein
MHPASYPMCTWAFVPRVQWPGHEDNHVHLVPSLKGRERKSALRAYGICALEVEGHNVKRNVKLIALHV